MRKPDLHNAFTLVELAIVLVIIGLLVGGVLAGQELIQVSARNKTIRKVYELDRAVNAFRLKYGALPGDMKNETTYITGVTGNGDGNNIIGDNWIFTEYSYFWQALEYSSLFIPEAQTIVHGAIRQIDLPNTPWAVPFYFSAGSTFPGGGYFLATTYPLKYKHGIFIWGSGGADQITGSWTEGGYKTDYMAPIDTKVDDGKPLTGTILGRGSSEAACLSGTDYILNNSAQNCIYLWYMNF